MSFLLNEFMFLNQPLRNQIKNLLFDQQERITTEHHLNLFIKYEDLDRYDDDIELHKTISFSGYVEKYQRSNGSWDWGIYPARPSTLHYRLGTIINVCWELAKIDEVRYSQRMVDYCNDFAKPNLEKCLKELESSGDLLPTFHKTYDEYKEMLDEWLWGVNWIANRVSSVRKTRDFRRGKYKVKKNTRGKVKQNPNQFTLYGY